jgi:hypothetical protein
MWPAWRLRESCVYADHGVPGAGARPGASTPGGTSFTSIGEQLIGEFDHNLINYFAGGVVVVDIRRSWRVASLEKSTDPKEGQDQSRGAEEAVPARDLATPPSIEVTVSLQGVVATPA